MYCFCFVYHLGIKKEYMYSVWNRQRILCFRYKNTHICILEREFSVLKPTVAIYMPANKCTVCVRVCVVYTVFQCNMVLYMQINYLKI